MQTSLATIKGTMLVPGVSKNNRLYTQAAIGRGVNRMNERLSDPNGLPIVMRTHHEAGDDSRKIVGRITRVWQEANGAAKYEAKLFNNEAGRDLAPLVAEDEDGKAALRTTSIHGFWVGPTERLKQDSGPVETGEDLEINAIDFTWSPGVAGARIDSVMFESAKVDWSGNESQVLDGKNIFESMEAVVSLDEVVRYDDPFSEDYNTAQRRTMAAKGQAMPGGRYPIASKSDLRKAIRAVGRGKGSHDTIRQHIIKRAKALGLINMIPSSWTSENVTFVTPDGKEIRKPAFEASRRSKGRVKENVSECYIKVCVGDDDGEMLQISADNLSPDIIKKAIKRAASLAKDILANNSDGTMDDAEDDEMVDDADCIDFKVVMASAGDSDVAADNMDSTGNGGNNSTGENANATNTTEAVMTDTSAATAAPVGENINYDKIGAVVATAVAESLMAMKKANKEAKAAKKAAESASAVTAETKKADEQKALKESITPEQLEAKLVEERQKTIAELRETLLKEKGVPQRQGFRTSVNENDTGELKGDDLWDKRGEVWAQAAPSIFGVPAA